MTRLKIRLTLTGWLWVTCLISISLSRIIYKMMRSISCFFFCESQMKKKKSYMGSKGTYSVTGSYEWKGVKCNGYSGYVSYLLCDLNHVI